MRNDSFFSDPLWWFVILPTLFIGGLMIVGAIWAAHQHTEFLEQHGCQMIHQSETGRRVYCGKACTKPEVVQVFECADGMRLELH